MTSPGRPIGVTLAAHVLLVDDDDTSRHVIQVLLAQDGHRVQVREEAAAAAAALHEASFDLVLLGVGRSGLDGIQYLRDLRALATTPAMMIGSAVDGDEIDGVLCLELGADDYLLRSIRPRELLARCTPCCAGPARTLVLRRHGFMPGI